MPMSAPNEQNATLWGNGHKPVRITKGHVYIGDDEFLHPIAEGSIKVEPLGKRGRFNLLTVTLVVGEVTMEAQQPIADGFLPGPIVDD